MFQDPDLLLSHIGITGLDADRPKGFLRYRMEDFVVHEVQPDGTVISIKPSRSVPDDVGEHRTLFVNLIKSRLSTPKAVELIAKQLGIAEMAIGYAEGKDVSAVTAQRISLRGVEWPKVASVKIPNIQIEPVAYGSGVISRGELQGNRYTVLVRTDGQESAERLRFLIDAYNRLGFANFFGLQSFGSRLVNHKVGCLLARGDFDGALRLFFTEVGPTETPLSSEARMKVAGCYGNWREMRRTFGEAPQAFSRELAILDRLITEPAKTVDAWRAVPESVRLMVNSYAAWMVNRYLSKVQKGNETIPDLLPLPISEKAEDRACYADLWSDDGVADPVGALRGFSFISWKPRTIPARVFPQVERVTKIDEGVVFVFTLPKNVHGTTYLLHLYRLHGGRPVPGWVKTGP